MKRALICLSLVLVAAFAVAQDAKVFFGEWELIRFGYNNGGSPFLPYVSMNFADNGRVEIQQRFSKYQKEQLKEEERWTMVKYRLVSSRHIEIGQQKFFFEVMNENKILMLRACCSDGFGWEYDMTCLLVRGEESEKREPRMENPYMGFDW